MNPSKGEVLPMIVTRHEDIVIEAANALRGPAYALGRDVGNEYVLSLSDCWRRHGVNGVRAACWSLASIAAEIPGAWEIYVRARQVAGRT